MLVSIAVVLAQAACIFAQNSSLPLPSSTVVENRTIDEIYQAALQEGGIVTLWHGGDEVNQQDGLKKAFEARFPGMTLNSTVDLSKYHDGLLDEQLANNNVYVDSIVLQTLHDYPRWKEEGALLHYAPIGFDKIDPRFKDEDAAFYGYKIFGWNVFSNGAKWNNASGPIQNYADFLNPALKDKIAITYPNDDDAVLFVFQQVMNKLGSKWFDAFLAQNPRWVRGTATPSTLIRQANTTYTASFIGGGSGLNSTHPTDAPFITWPQTAAIVKNAPHPEGAKLLHNFMISKEFLEASPSYSVRTDAPANFPNVFEETNTDPLAFGVFMADRAKVERLRFWFEERIGTAQGLSPLVDGI